MSAAPDPKGLHRVARLSRLALDRSLQRLVDERGSDAIIDIRIDAYGHGAVEVESVAREHGFTRFLRDDDDASAVDDDGLPYGFAPGLTPVLSLEGEVIATKRVPAGTPVSYGYTYRTVTESTLALVGLGYADGIPRRASGCASGRIGDSRGTIAGRVAMDQLVLDLGSASARPGDRAVLWDDADSLDEWCRETKRPPSTLTGRLGPRITRVWADT